MRVAKLRRLLAMTLIFKWSWPAAFFIISLFWSPYSLGQSRDGNEEFYFNIPRLSADKALTRFAMQTELTLLFPYREVKKVKTRPLHGRFILRCCLMCSIAVLLIKMAGKRKKNTTVKPLQLPLFPEKKAA